MGSLNERIEEARSRWLVESDVSKRDSLAVTIISLMERRIAELETLQAPISEAVEARRHPGLDANLNDSQMPQDEIPAHVREQRERYALEDAHTRGEHLKLMVAGCPQCEDR